MSPGDALPGDGAGQAGSMLAPVLDVAVRVLRGGTTDDRERLDDVLTARPRWRPVLRAALLEELVALGEPVHRARAAVAAVLGDDLPADTVWMADVVAVDVDWLWDGRLPRGRLSVLMGDPGAGKSTVSCLIVAHVTTGLPWPGEYTAREPGNVLMLTAEDGLADTVRRRLDGCGADVSRVHSLPLLVAGEPMSLAEPRHLDVLRRVCESLRPSLVTIDPLSAYLYGVDSHRDVDVRSVLAPLAELAEAVHAAILTIAHLNKSAAARALYRQGGSIAFAAAARVQMLAGHPPDNPDRRALTVTKCNLAPHASTLGYRLVDGRAEWTGQSDVTAGQILAPETDDESRSSVDEACDFLRGALEAGARPTEEIVAEAKRNGHAPRTLKRARSELGVVAERRGKPGPGGDLRWFLRLPANPEKLDGHASTAERGPLTRGPLTLPNNVVAPEQLSADMPAGEKLEVQQPGIRPSNSESAENAGDGDPSCGTAEGSADPASGTAEGSTRKPCRHCRRAPARPGGILCARCRHQLGKIRFPDQEVTDLLLAEDRAAADPAATDPEREALAHVERRVR